jgi:hypothetical protein
LSRRHRGRGKQSLHFHAHQHQHRTVILPPAQLPLRPLTPTMQNIAVNAPMRINQKTSYKTFAPTVTATQTNYRPLVAAPAPVRQEDDFGGFVCGLLSAVAIGLAIFGGGGGGSGGGPKR